MTDAIGGYFGLEPVVDGIEFYGDALRVQSARAALLAAFAIARPARVWLPWYLCGCIADVLASRSIPIARYTLTALDAVPDIDLIDGDVLVYANYFGLGGEAVSRVLARFGADRVIVDGSQAFYARPPAGARAIYSARKFFGVPDGGYLCGPELPQLELALDDGTPARMTHLVQRLSGDIEGGYVSFQAAEATLATSEIRAMSPMTRALMERIDYDGAARQRRDNFAALHAALGAANRLDLTLAPDAVPMCYPLLLEPGTPLRSRLIAERIFVPQYWPELAALLPPDAVNERRWTENLLPLPCDQRYTPAVLQRVIDVIEAGRRSPVSQTEAQ